LKRKTAYVCSDCGASALQWFGACPSCGAAGTLSETLSEKGSRSKERIDTVALADLQPRELVRIPTGMEELDRALGGGLVPGQVVLLGGDPGVGKSTLLLQALSSLSEASLYVTGEESADQVAMRARRLGLEAKGMQLLAETQLERVLGALEGIKRHRLKATVRLLNGGECVARARVAGNHAAVNAKRRRNERVTEQPAPDLGKRQDAADRTIALGKQVMRLVSEGPLEHQAPLRQMEERPLLARAHERVPGRGIGRPKRTNDGRRGCNVRCLPREPATCHLVKQSGRPRPCGPSGSRAAAAAAALPSCPG